MPIKNGEMRVAFCASNDTNLVETQEFLFLMVMAN